MAPALAEGSLSPTPITMLASHEVVEKEKGIDVSILPMGGAFGGDAGVGVEKMGLYIPAVEKEISSSSSDNPSAAADAVDAQLGGSDMVDASKEHEEDQSGARDDAGEINSLETLQPDIGFQSLPPSTPGDADAASASAPELDALQHAASSIPLPADDSCSSTSSSTSSPTLVSQQPTLPQQQKSEDYVTPQEFFDMLSHGYLDTLVIDTTSVRPSDISIPGSRRLAYIQKMRSKLERRYLVDLTVNRKKHRHYNVPILFNSNGVGVSPKKKKESGWEGFGDAGNGFAKVETLEEDDELDWDDDDYDDESLYGEEDSDDDLFDSDDEDRLDDFMDAKDTDGDSIMTDSPTRREKTRSLSVGQGLEGWEGTSSSSTLASTSSSNVAPSTSAPPSVECIPIPNQVKKIPFIPRNIKLALKPRKDMPLHPIFDSLPLKSTSMSSSKRMDFLSTLDYVSAASELSWDLMQVNDIWFHRRLDGDIVIYDDDGDPYGFAASVAFIIQCYNRARSVRYLQGGIKAFGEMFPLLVHPVPVLTADEEGKPLLPVSPDPPNPRMTPEPTSFAEQEVTRHLNQSPLSQFPHLIRRSAVIPNRTEFPHIPRTISSVRDLQEVQAHLIASVWYGRKEPVGDLPLPILPPFLYLGSCFAAHRHHVGYPHNNIRHVLRLGWGFEDQCPKAPARAVHRFMTEEPSEESRRGLLRKNKEREQDFLQRQTEYLAQQYGHSFGEGFVRLGDGSKPSVIVNEPEEIEEEEGEEQHGSHEGLMDEIEKGTVIYHDFPIEDSPREPIRRLFEETSEIIERARRRGEGVLVHCHAGVSRSATIVLAYLMRFGRLTLYEAWNLTYKSRPIIRPNDGFSRALQDLEREIHGFEKPTLPLYWMSESYAYYMEYLEMKERLEYHGEVEKFLRERQCEAARTEEEARACAGVDAKEE
ncbi:Dual specificity protein phosphatase 10 [Phlyctochytrium planicorne]|nr:Dual specificity protein phosphatase 10 [Phlyctochytrium planicorne]